MIEVNVCIGSACHLRGAYNVIQVFQQMIEEKQLHEKVELKGSFCMRQCQKEGVSVTMGGNSYTIKPESAKDFFTQTVLPQVQ
ncbi:MAG: (2Fe-2S) ferredoxin domain-containing protein [Oscillospiraceae bacterium]